MTLLRSWLFIPGDSEKKLGKADASDADAVILDLEDSVVPDAKDAARKYVLDHLATRPPESRRAELWVRVNSIEDTALKDLATIVPGAPKGIVLPKCEGPEDVLRLSHWLEALETAHGLTQQIGILPVATETALGTLKLAQFAEAHIPRLIGLTWGAEDLATALGASTNQARSGGWAPTYRMVRSQVLLAAKAAGIAAIETLHSDFQDEEGLRTSSQQAAEEGFEGRLAIHPAQIAAINESFVPSEEAISQARKVIEAFEGTGAGVISLDGKMLDRPHLRQAEALVARHNAAQEKAAKPL